MSDLLDELEGRKSEPEFGGDYAPWWEPEEGDTLVGVITELHSAPSKFTPEGEVPPPVRTIVSIGEGDYEMGKVISTRTHKNLLHGLEETEIGDVVLISYLGYKKFEGSNNASNAYEVGIVKKDELEANEDWLTLVEMTLSDYDGPEGDNRRTDPVTSNESDAEPSTEKQSTDSLTEAAAFLKQLIDMQDGTVSIEQADKMLNDVREFDVDLENTAAMIGATIDDDEITLED